MLVTYDFDSNLTQITSVETIMFIYKGSCHCGRVKFEVRKQKAIDTLIECNCSICTKKGILHTQVEDDELVVHSGEDEMTLYQFGTMVAGYTFCPGCGCNPFHRSRGRPRGYSVNARCLDDLDELLANNQVWFANGRDHPLDRDSEELEALPMPYRAHVGKIPNGVIEK